MAPSTRNVWLLRAAWLLVALVSVPAYGQALESRSGAVQVVAAVGLWMGWTAVLLATLVPSPASLSALRILTPGAPVAAVAAAIAGAGAVAAAVAIAVALVAAIVAGTAEVGG